ncbi:4-oxalocrotonate tautomerase family protein [Bacillus cereus]|nr:4-oxalocrotonate tautomerase family protein [Bacillus cereus]
MLDNKGINIVMPFVNISLTKNNITKQQKAEIVYGFTHILQEVLGKSPDRTMIVINEINPENWGSSGILVSDRESETLK